MINRKTLFLTTFFSLFFYRIVFAEQTFKTVVEKFVGEVKEPLISLFFTASVVSFAYGISKYITGGEMTKSSAREYMIWGIVGIAVMSAVWGFVSVFKNTFGL